MTPAQLAEYFRSAEFMSLDRQAQHDKVAALQRELLPQRPAPSQPAAPPPPVGARMTPTQLTAYFNSPEFKGLTSDQQRKRLDELQAQHLPPGRGAR